MVRRLSLVQFNPSDRNHMQPQTVYFSRAYFPFQDHCESVAILKIKESMQEEARRFENTDGTTDPQGEFFMQ